MVPVRAVGIAVIAVAEAFTISGIGLCCICGSAT